MLNFVKSQITSVQAIFVVDIVVSYFCIYCEYYLNRRYLIMPVLINVFCLLYYALLYVWITKKQGRCATSLHATGKLQDKMIVVQGPRIQAQLQAKSFIQE